MGRVFEDPTSDVSLHVLSFLNATELCSISSCSVSFSRALEPTSHVWHNLLENDECGLVTIPRSWLPGCGPSGPNSREKCVAVSKALNKLEMTSPDESRVLGKTVDHDSRGSCVLIGGHDVGLSSFFDVFHTGVMTDSEMREQMRVWCRSVKVKRSSSISTLLRLKTVERNPDCRQSPLAGALFHPPCVLLCIFDVTRHESVTVLFDHISRITRLVPASQRLPKILVGNKTDLVDKRKLSREQCEAIAAEHDMIYVEASVLKNRGVGTAFTLAAHVLEEMNKRSEEGS